MPEYDELVESIKTAASMSDESLKALYSALQAACWDAATRPINSLRETGVPDPLADTGVEYGALPLTVRSAFYEFDWICRLGRFNSEASGRKLSLLDESLDLLGFQSVELPSVARSNSLLRALCHHERQDYDLSRACFDAAHHQYSPASTSISRLFSYSRSVVSGLGSHLLNRHFPDALVVTSDAPYCFSNRPAIATAANPDYIAKFFGHYLESLIDSGAPDLVDLHLYIISDPSVTSVAADSSRVSSLVEHAKRAFGPHFYVHSVAVPYHPDLRSLYAACRFLVASELLRYCPHVILTDIDYEVVGDIESFISMTAGYAISFRESPSHLLQSWMPWLRIMAGTVSLTAAPSSMAGLATFSKLFHFTFWPRLFNWGIDQNILFEMARLHFSTQDSLDIRGRDLFMPPSFKFVQ